MDENKLFAFPPQCELYAKLSAVAQCSRHAENILPIFGALGSLELVATGIANHLNMMLGEHFRHIEKQSGKRKAWLERVIVVAHLKPFLVASIEDGEVAAFVQEYLAMCRSR